MKRLLTYILCFSFLSIICVHAQDKQNMFNPVTTGVTSMSIAPDARGGGLGDAGAATEADVHSQYWNPAKYPFNVARAGVALSYTPWLRKIVNDINLLNLVGFYRIGNYSAVSASLRYFSLGEVNIVEGTTISDMTIKPYELAFDVGYSRMLSQTFSMAVAMRFIYSDITYKYTSESSPGKAFAADIAMYRLGYFMAGRKECSFGWGINISNIGTKISYGGDDNSQFLPTNLRIGMNFTIPFDAYNKLNITLDANKLLVPTYPKQKTGETETEYTDRVQKEYYDVSPIAGIFKSFYDAPNGFKEELQEIQLCGGLEYSYDDRFFARVGYHHESENKGNRKYITAGAGFHMSIFSLDASYVFAIGQTNALDQTMRFSLGFDLDGIKDLFGKKSNKKRK